jgi:hypothetical protein
MYSALAFCDGVKIIVVLIFGFVFFVPRVVMGGRG